MKSACKSLGICISKKNSFHIVSIKSTVVPLTVDEIVIPILENRTNSTAGEGFGIAMTPEFLKE